MKKTKKLLSILLAILMLLTALPMNLAGAVVVHKIEDYDGNVTIIEEDVTDQFDDPDNTDYEIVIDEPIVIEPPTGWDDRSIFKYYLDEDGGAVVNGLLLNVLIPDRLIGHIYWPADIDALGDAVYINPELAPARIPQTIDGHRVVGIADGFLDGHEYIETLELPSTLKYIGENAFRNCVNLKSIKCEALDLVIEETAFSGCTSLETVEFTNTCNLTICKEAFANCDSLESLSLGDYGEGTTTTIGILHIEEKAFYDCDSLKDVSFADRILFYSVGKEAFASCDSLKTVYFGENALTGPTTTGRGYLEPDGSTVFTIENRAFADCVSLERVEFDAGYCYDNIADDVFTVDGEPNPSVTAYSDSESLVKGLLSVGVNATCINHRIDSDVLNKAATCTEPGYKDGIGCSVCNYVEAAPLEIPALGHTPASAVIENEVAATCKAVGSYDEVVYCAECGEEISRTAKTIDKAAHTPAAAVIENEVDATCQVAGSYDEVVYCAECGAEISRTTKTTPKAEHRVPFAVHSDDGSVAPTCTSAGRTAEVACLDCGEIVVPSEVIPALRHLYKLVSTTEPTDTTKGERKYKCVYCGDDYSEEIEALGTHSGRSADNDSSNSDSLRTGKRCKFCPKYEQNKDVPVIGIFYMIVHFFIHLFTAK